MWPITLHFIHHPWDNSLTFLRPHELLMRASDWWSQYFHEKFESIFIWRTPQISHRSMFVLQISNHIVRCNPGMVLIADENVYQVFLIFSNGRQTNESSAEESSAMLAAFWLAIEVFPGVMNIHRKRRFVSQLSQGWWMKCNVMDHTWVTEDGWSTV